MIVYATPASSCHVTVGSAAVAGLVAISPGGTGSIVKSNDQLALSPWTVLVTLTTGGPTLTMSHTASTPGATGNAVSGPCPPSYSGA